jgi:membrane fusion protein (multidrug efflux system)
MQRSFASRVLTGAIAVSAAVPGAGCATPEAKARSLTTEAAVAVPLREVVARPVPKSLLLTGTLVANRESDLAADAAGKVVATFAERGERVQQGQPLARLDARGAALTQAEARARVESARVEQAHATLECQRAEHLFRVNAISRAEFDRSRAGCDGAKHAAAAASAREGMAVKSIGDATIRAPFAGEVVERYVNVGEYVQPGTRVATVVDLDSLWLEIAVPESSMAHVRERQSVRFQVAAYPGETFTGEVRYLGAALRRAGRDLMVEATVANTGRRLRPGMFATARIDTGSTALPVVPASALLGSGRSRRAFVVREQTLEERVVLVGDPVGDGFAVLSGVKPGERVAGRTGNDVKDGARVR